jgi:hypothetical protein
MLWISNRTVTMSSCAKCGTGQETQCLKVELMEAPVGEMKANLLTTKVERGLYVQTSPFGSVFTGLRCPFPIPFDMEMDHRVRQGEGM